MSTRRREWRKLMPGALLLIGHVLALHIADAQRMVPHWCCDDQLRHGLHIFERGEKGVAKETFFPIFNLIFPNFVNSNGRVNNYKVSLRWPLRKRGSKGKKNYENRPFCAARITFPMGKAMISIGKCISVHGMW